MKHSTTSCFLSFPSALIAACLCLPAVQSRAQTTLFADDFGNVSATDSQFIPAFWTPVQPANTSVVETGQSVVVTAGGAASPDGTLAPYLRSGAPSPDLNFFRQQLRFTATISVTGTASPSQQLMRFGFSGTTSDLYTTEDAFAVRISATNVVSVSTKQNRPGVSSEGVNLLVSNVNVGSTITGFALVLNSTHYDLVVLHTGGTGSTAFSGTHGLVAAQWGADGDSTMHFQTIRATGASAGAGLDAVAEVTSLTVERLAPPPPLVEDSFGNGAPSDSDVDPAFWTPTLPQTSTVAEDGRLVLTANASTADAILASHRSTPGTSANFFDKQIRVSADLTVSGSTASNFMSRGQLVLASGLGDSNQVPDTLLVGFRKNSNSIALNRKLNAPYVRADHASHASVVSLLEGNETIAFSGSDLVNRFELSLNGSRYRLDVFNGGKFSGINRFTGSHGVPLQEWNANGDSALLLESQRIAAAANTSAVSTWDNLRVENDARRMLDERFYVFQAQHPGGTMKDYRMWLPSTEPIIRGVIFIAPGTGEDFRYSVHDKAAQEAARILGFGLIGYVSGGAELFTDSTAAVVAAIQPVLDAAAAVSGRPEICNAPLCYTGLSQGAFSSVIVARRWPERVIAFVSHRGNEFSDVTLSAETKRVPGLMIAGSTDANSLTNPWRMEQRFKHWRAQDAQVAFAVDWQVGHTIRGNQGWEAGFAWMVEVASLRYPRPMSPSQIPGAGSPALLEITTESGWLGDIASFSNTTTPSVTSPFTNVAPFASYAGDASTASWMPNETCARVYRALTSTDLVARTVAPLQSPLRIASPTQYADPVIIGQTFTIEVDPREFSHVTPLTSVEFYNGDQLLGTDTQGPRWSVEFTPQNPGLLSLTAVATDALGNQRAAMRTLWVEPSTYPPVSHGGYQGLIVSTSGTGQVSGTNPEGGGVTFGLVQEPTHGLFLFDPNTGAYAYQPAHGYTGPDTFTYTAVGGATASTYQFSISLGVDANANSLPDAWESAHNVLNPGEDEDGDGYTSRQEYYALTDPQDPTDRLQVEATSAGNGIPVVLRWPSKGGVRYRVEFTDDLSEEWTEVVRPLSTEIQPGAYGVEGESEWTDDSSTTGDPAAGRRFYRITVVSGGD